MCVSRQQLAVPADCDPPRLAHIVAGHERLTNATARTFGRTDDALLHVSSKTNNSHPTFFGMPGGVGSRPVCACAWSYSPSV